jgi:hypothetical protein
MKVVINGCFGGFGLSKAALERFEELGGVTMYTTTGIPYIYDIKRDDPALVQTVEELGKLANDQYAELVVVEIPDDAEWYIAEYDGNEWVAEGRTWP